MSATKMSGKSGFVSAVSCKRVARLLNNAARMREVCHASWLLISMENGFAFPPGRGTPSAIMKVGLATYGGAKNQNNISRN